MAGDWIKFRKVLLRDGRVRIVSRTCHAPVTHIVGALVTLWAFADDYADESGVLFGYTIDDINNEVGIKKFCESLPECWIDLSGEWVKLPEYQEHNGSTGKKRAQDQARQKRHRSVTDTSRSNGDKKATREEKRREDNKKSNKKRFIKPKPQEVTDYALTIDFVLDGEHFCDYYQTRGWELKRNQPMKDWKAAVSTWKRNAVKNGEASDSSQVVDPIGKRIDEIKAGQEAGKSLFINVRDEGLVEVALYTGFFEYKSDSSKRTNAYQYLKAGNVVQVGDGGE
ncbi:MAG: hypothetical protein KAQ89_06875 [Planctomycetes bacterium]|nr:hypothetical protein [Planctomycetota bacterium]